MNNVSTFRLYLMRALYFLMAMGNIVTQGPGIIHHPDTWSMWRGVGMAFLGALALMSLLGIRYPLKMVPLLIFELAWKAVYVLAFGLPLYAAHTVTADTAETTFNCLMGIVLVPIVMPWAFVWRQFVKAPGDRWGKAV